MNDTRFAELISKIAHELRSPLTSVKGFSSTLVRRWDRFSDEQRFQFVETIYKDSERMARIVAEVLDLARLEAGWLELNRTRVDLGDLSKRATEQLSDLPGAERVRIEIHDGAFAWADGDRLEHVMSNLIENAIKFSEEGPIVVSATTADHTIDISVSDDGIGIEADRLADLFSGPAPPGGSKMPSGSGLGLYLSRRLVEAHGGSITVESTAGAGSTFVVSLPVPPD